VTLNDGPTTIQNKLINGLTGVMGENATSVTTLTMTNVTINSTNYGVYLGDCDAANFSDVDITCDPNGPDSYSVRGYIRNFVSSDSTYRSGIKAFRIYGLTSGSSTRDIYRGDRLMLGGGPANEWGTPLSFANFTFSDGEIRVNSVEMYNATHHVTFNHMDFATTGHISIQYSAHHITFNQCANVPEIKFYNSSGVRYYPSASELASRNIAFNN